MWTQDTESTVDLGRFTRKPKESKLIPILETLIIWFVPLFSAYLIIICLLWVLFDYKLVEASI